jgi:NitT/TauT family transport system ATP-binding protein
MTEYKIENLFKSFNDKIIFANFHISFQENEITCILGPSGCGKTTLLNIIGSLIKADVKINGFKNKRIAYIFQEPRLLPWKTARENIEIVTADGKINNQLNIDEILDMVRLTDQSNLYPHQLSGGMKQRVSIARAFAYKPDIILMDEPFKGLDIKLKSELIEEFKKIWRTENNTVLFVTHDHAEAINLSDTIYVFSKSPVEIKGKFRSTEYSNKIPLLGEKLIELLNL